MKKSNKNTVYLIGGYIPCSIIHSDRKTAAIQVKRDGTVAVRCPRSMADKRAAEFAEEHRQWVEKYLAEAEKRQKRHVDYTDQEILQYRQQARSLLTRKTEFWAEKMQVTYGRITIRQQATRWGSCSAKGNLNFNWKLVLVPEELADYVVVHELAHRREMNHSPRFWAVVAEQLPDYETRRKRLRAYED